MIARLLSQLLPPPATDLWRVGIVARTPGVMHARMLCAQPPRWIDNPGPYRFYADPFGLEADGCLHVLAEAYDYRSKHGHIAYFTFDAALNLRASGVALQTPHHLSYPFLIRDADAIYLLPEAHRSGRLTLYRAEQFPHRWQEAQVLLGLPAIDPSVIAHDGRWWLFFTLPGHPRALSELHVAYADALTGLWHLHPRNPVRVAPDSARPGGTPFVLGGEIILPVQDNRVTYGGGLRLLRITQLSPQDFAADILTDLDAPVDDSGFTHGIHTLSEAGNWLLFDVKRIHRGQGRRLVNLQRRWRRIAAPLGL